ncbi:endonuclease [Bacteroidia bacterium]|nr:endonuclease [Bacteroidia bacterium]
MAVGFYNVENFYDTIPSLFYDDRDYTPKGRNHWNAERYARKLGNIVRVLDHMSLDLIALAEVENEAVVRDLVETLSTDYCYIHRTTSDRRGMDLAVLYKGDKFIPERVRQVDLGASRQALHIRGRLVGSMVDVVVCHLPSALNSNRYRTRALRSLADLVDSLRLADPRSGLVVMGDMNCTPDERIVRENFPTGRGAHLIETLEAQRRQGEGSYVYRGDWQMVDNIFVTENMLYGNGLRLKEAGVFIRDYLLSEGGAMPRGWPLRTFAGRLCLGGYSDHLPVFIILEKMPKAGMPDRPAPLSNSEKGYSPAKPTEMN